MNTIFSDLARERFAAELATASADKLRGLAYSYLGLAELSLPASTSPWQWKVEMVREECERRGLHDLFESERIVVEHESTAVTGGLSLS